jgi:hypothetical protein
VAEAKMNLINIEHLDFLSKKNSAPLNEKKNNLFDKSQ